MLASLEDDLRDPSRSLAEKVTERASERERESEADRDRDREREGAPIRRDPPMSLRCCLR